jgi:predicted negative regulator of RcsB-dependent stress response
MAIDTKEWSKETKKAIALSVVVILGAVLFFSLIG